MTLHLLFGFYYLFWIVRVILPPPTGSTSEWLRFVYCSSFVGKKNVKTVAIWKYQENTDF